MIKKIKRKLLLGMTSLYCGMVCTTVPVSASLGDELQNTTTTIHNEAFGIAETLGLAGIVICGVAWFFGQKEFAKRGLIAVVCGFLVIKYAPQIWAVISGGI